MTHTIENENLILTVADHGAEITSLIRKSDGLEVMWQADSAYWARTSPVLFPLVGNYYEKKSIYKGKTYEMGQHGFARDMDFDLASVADNQLSFKLTDDSTTHEKYPFSFELIITYTLKDNTVNVGWQVRNTNDETMYFSIGAHPAFNCNLDTYSLKFEKSGKILETITSNVISNDGSGCLSEVQDTYSLVNGALKMSDKLFSKDALVIEDKQADKVTILDNDGAKYISVTCPTPLFGVWSPVGKHAPFVCIEPWFGRCDRVGFNQKLEEREYGNTLAASDTFKAAYDITVW